MCNVSCSARWRQTCICALAQTHKIHSRCASVYFSAFVQTLQSTVLVLSDLDFTVDIDIQPCAFFSIPVMVYLIELSLWPCVYASATSGYELNQPIISYRFISFHTVSGNGVRCDSRACSTVLWPKSRSKFPLPSLRFSTNVCVSNYRIVYFIGLHKRLVDTVKYTRDSPKAEFVTELFVYSVGCGEIDRYSSHRQYVFTLEKLYFNEPELVQPFPLHKMPPRYLRLVSICMHLTGDYE